MAEKFGDSTLLIIAHRLDTVMGTDRILVVDNGTILVRHKQNYAQCNSVVHLQNPVQLQRYKFMYEFIDCLYSEIPPSGEQLVHLRFFAFSMQFLAFMEGFQNMRN